MLTHISIILFFLGFLEQSSSLICSTFCTYTIQNLNYAPACYGQNYYQCTACDNRFFMKSLSYCNLFSQGILNSTLSVSASSGWTHQDNLLVQTNAVYDSSTYTKLKSNVQTSKANSLPSYTYGLRIRLTLIDNTHSTSCKLYIVIGDGHQQCMLHPKSKDSNYNLDSWIHTTQFIQYTQRTSINIIIKRNQTSPVEHHLGFRDILIMAATCKTGCSSCSSLNDCYSCAYPTRYLDNQTKQCLSSCLPGTYANSYNCYPCDPKCLQCSSYSYYCSSCVQFGAYQSFYHNTRCYEDCPYGYHENYDTHICQCPSQYYYTQSIYCYSCYQTCLTCFGNSQHECNSCIYGSYLVNGTNTCADQCPIGQYQFYLDNLALCYLCDQNCYQCQDNFIFCTSCSFSDPEIITFLDKNITNTCVQLCPDGYQGNYQTNICDQCPLGEYSYKNKCYSQCPEYYTHNDQTRACTLSQGYPLVMKLGVHSIDNLQFTIYFPLKLRNDSLYALQRQWKQFINLYMIIDKQPNFSILSSSKKTNKRFLQSAAQNYGRQITIINSDVNQQRMILQTNRVSQQDLTQSTTFQILFKNNIYSPENVMYQIRINQSTNNEPWIISEYYTKKLSPLHFVGVAITSLILLSILVAFIVGVKGLVATLTIQYLHMLQIIGLMLFSIYPRSLSPILFSYLLGINYSNLDFIYNFLRQYTYACLNQCSSLTSYAFIQGDMSWLRSMGSILLFFAFIMLLSLILYIPKYCRGLSSIILRLSIQLIILKSIHSWFSSLVFLILNYNQTTTKNIEYSSHIFAYFFLAPTLAITIKFIANMSFPQSLFYGHASYFRISILTKILIVILEVLIPLAPFLICTFIVLACMVCWILLVGFDFGPRFYLLLPTLKDKQEIEDFDGNNQSYQKKRSSNKIKIANSLGIQSSPQSKEQEMIKLYDNKLPKCVVFHKYLLYSFLPITIICLSSITLISNTIVIILLISGLLTVMIILIIIDSVLLHRLYRKQQQKKDVDESHMKTLEPAQKNITEQNLVQKQTRNRGKTLQTQNTNPSQRYYRRKKYQMNKNYAF